MGVWIASLTKTLKEIRKTKKIKKQKQIWREQGLNLEDWSEKSEKGAEEKRKWPDYVGAVGGTFEIQFVVR